MMFLLCIFSLLLVGGDFMLVIVLGVWLEVQCILRRNVSTHRERWLKEVSDHYVIVFIRNFFML